MKTRTIGIVIVVAVVVVAAVLAIALRDSSSGEPSTGGVSSGGSATVDVMAPGDFSLAAYAGQPLVVNFFGSWCGPCNLEAPDLATFAADSGAQIVGITYKDTEEDALGFMEEYGLDFPLVIDDDSLATEYAITGVPTTIFFDAQGQETDRLVGASSLDQFSAAYAQAQ
jgi:thiol-disulfide isomerase/thioredoxin